MNRRGTCQTCGKHTSRAEHTTCAACYHGRGRKTDPVATCPECQGPMSTKASKRCRKCWAAKPNAKRYKPPAFCKMCGKRVTRGSEAGLCRTCYDDDRQLAQIAAVSRDEVESTASGRRLPSDYDEHVRLLRHFIGCAQQDYRGPAKARTSTTQRVAVLSDLHAPFQHNEAFADFLEREKGADVCIMGGDLQDHYSISRFLKYESVPMESELAAAQMILEKLSETFPHVLCIEGNHDSPRFQKMLVDRLPQEAVKIIQHLSGGTLSTMEAMCRQFPNVELVKNRVAGRFDVSWYVQHGDLIVSHAEKFSRVPMSTLRGVEEWFRDFEGTLGLQPWKVILQAHTHALSWHPIGHDKILGETGCLCQQHGYQLSARIGGRPQRVGWVTLEQTQGVTDLSSVSPFWWEAWKRRAA